MLALALWVVAAVSFAGPKPASGPIFTAITHVWEKSSENLNGRRDLSFSPRTWASGDSVALAGGAGASTTEALTPVLTNYLTANNIDPNSPNGKLLMDLATAAIGGVVGGLTGGGSGALLGGNASLDSEMYNRQLHYTVRLWITQNAQYFAQQQNANGYQNPDGSPMTVAQATQILAQQALYDNQAGVNVAPNAAAEAFLNLGQLSQNAAGNPILLPNDIHPVSLEQFAFSNINAQAGGGCNGCSNSTIDNLNNFYQQNGLNGVQPNVFTALGIASYVNSINAFAANQKAGDLNGAMLVLGIAGTPLLVPVASVAASGTVVTAQSVQMACMSNPNGCVGVASAITTFLSELSGATFGANSGTTTLYRAVLDPELKSIQFLNAFSNPAGIEGKYFSTTLEGAQSYASQATAAFGDGPFSFVQTSISTSSITPGMTAMVDRGIPSIVVPTGQLLSLTPPVILGH